jgi:hypothetical protein
MDISTIFSVLSGAIHLAITVPTLAIGVVVGAAGYAFLAKRYPTLAASLVTKATDTVQSVIAAELAKVAAAKAAQSNITTTTASAATPTKATIVTPGDNSAGTSK